METIKKENRFFVYENETLIAAQHKLNNANRYLKEDRRIFYGNPDNPQKKDITNITNKIYFKCK